ncbi:hypothetical protein CJ195_20630 [Bacillus sp. UMB0899]|nr:hypothetical protein CJ195_20630 [Bacillus sp. UMB0899]
MKKKIAFVSSFTLATLLVAGQFTYAEKPDGMMNGNGMSKMMEAMNSPEGQKMMKACEKFMETSDDSEVKDTSL